MRNQFHTHALARFARATDMGLPVPDDEVFWRLHWEEGVEKSPEGMWRFPTEDLIKHPLRR